ncbi:MAG: hypothetical protein NWE84_01930 [Candidatus Bathyarchaeota archaeon]|nr:hypothetical protein [Candidatus Bathyarchaeota archaeon]
MPKNIRWVAFAMATIAGVFLFISGIHGPTETYETIIDLLPQFIRDPQVLQIASIIATIFIAISLAGGLAVIGGGVLILIGRVGTGKFVISLGLGVGLFWLAMLAVTFISTQQVATVIAEYSTLGWAGIILAIAARTIAK